MNNKPMIAHVIEAVQRCGRFSPIVVSTDDAEIADVARASGASVPALRDSDLADDFTPMQAVIQNAITSFDLQTEWVAQIFATALLLRSETLQRAAEMATSCRPDIDFVMGLAPFPHPVQRALELGEDQRVGMLTTENAMTRTQDLPPRYFDAGQFVLGRRSAWLNGGSVWDRPTQGILLARDEAIDLDEPGDIALAKALMQSRAAER